jgi:hypothetical protein
LLAKSSAERPLPPRKTESRVTATNAGTFRFPPKTALRRLTQPIRQFKKYLRLRKNNFREKLVSE